MTCKKCGTEYEGTVCPNGCTTQKQKKPIFKKWWFWLAVGVVVVSIASAGDKEPSSSGSAGSNTNENNDVSIETTVAPDPYYHVGDIIDANGLKNTYVKAERHEEKNQFLQPDEGYIYVKLYLSVENTSNGDRYISSFDFDCYADGKKQEAYYSGEKALEGGTLSSGRKDEGYIYFSVPSGAKDIEVEYETSFWTDKKAILKVELS